MTAVEGLFILIFVLVFVRIGEVEVELSNILLLLSVSPAIFLGVERLVGEPFSSVIRLLMVATFIAELISCCCIRG